MSLSLNTAYSQLFYALTNREIHFQDDITGTIKVIGIRKSVDISDDSDSLLFIDEYPWIYIWKVLESLSKEPVAKIFAKKYENAIIKARRNLAKQARFGRTLPMDI